MIVELFRGIFWTSFSLLSIWLKCNSFTADRVFGPPTTTRRVYDIAAQQVVSGAMSGINGLFHLIPYGSER